jgi:tetratricopeptide (TPR) repeat protein
VSTSTEGLLAQAREALQAGEVEAAIKLFRSAAEAPDASAAVFLELADALWANFDFPEALRTLEDLAQREPANPMAALLAAKRMFTLGRFADSARLLSAALERQPADNTLRQMLAEVRDRESRLTEAETLAREALIQNPSNALAARSLAHTLRRANRIAEAQEVLSRQLREHPGQDDWRLNYELATCLDRQADYAGAMDALQRAKAQLRPTAKPLLAQWRARAKRREEFAHALDRETLERWQAMARQLRPVTPLAILAGHPRSGTTLLEQMLAAHPGVTTTDETGVLRSQFIEPIVLGAESTEASQREVNEFDVAQLEAGRAVYFRATAAHLGEPFDGRLLVEKDPLATQDLGFILRLLPESRVIFPLRDPRDVCVSFFFTLVPLNADSAPALDLAGTCASMALSLRLWRRWRRVIPQRWMEVRYEQLVRQPERELRSLLAALDLPWEQSVLTPAGRSDRGVRSPTYADVAQPLHSRAIGRWQHYAEWLEPHLGPLRELLKEFGYADGA